MNSREGSIVALAQRLASVNGVLDVCSQISKKKNAQYRARHGGQRKVLKLQLFKSVLDPIRGPRRFLSYTQVGNIQEVTDQRMLPILRGA